MIVTTNRIKVIPEGTVTTPQGFVASGGHCGIKRKKLDLAWIYSQVPATAGGVYTTNLFQAAPLVVTQDSINQEHKLQAVLINSGIANACTGQEGLADAYKTRQLFADHLGVASHYVAVVSTGLIGERLPMAKIAAGIQGIRPDVSEPSLFEQGILTTDTCTKHVAVQVEIDGKQVTIGGAAKGSGMINPNMATMLAFVTTDADIDHQFLTEALKMVTNETFNMITVDGDTSTNDMVLVLANGLAGNQSLTANHPEWEGFLGGLKLVCQELAKQIARDGEGATKLIEVQVNGASSTAGAGKIGKAIIMSNLVKAAIFGKDPNWGRIVCAIGYSGEQVDPQQVGISLGHIPVFAQGMPCRFEEADAHKYLEQDTIQIFVTVGDGPGKAVAYGCDLTYDYVRINAAYRT